MDQPEPLVDARIRPLLERYVKLAGAELTDVAQGLVELQLPKTETKWFHDRSSIRIAFTLDALESDPEAEIAVVGSALVEQLVAAIRAHGSRLSYGQLPPEHAADASSAELRVPITNGDAGMARTDIAWHKVVRLLARVVVRAGGEVEEHLLESGFFDATTGIALPAAIAEKCAALGARRVAQDKGARHGTRRAGRGRVPAQGGRVSAGDEGASAPSAPHALSRPAADLISLALKDLRGSLEAKVDRLREEARRKLHEELRRIDGYYESLLNDPAGRGAAVAESAARRAVEAEHARRRSEEERRHQVRAIVHPVQLTECKLLVQRAQWELVSQHGVRAPLLAERWLNGTGDWTLACPQCGATTIKSLSLCKSGHVACDSCALACGVCADVFCWDHGISACHIDGSPTCAEHARTCLSCGEPYCAAHEMPCADGDHPACSECIAPCAICGRTVCEDHAATTAASAPHGQRRLCRDCVRLCEGGTSEPVGADEATKCTSCEKYVCEQHRSICAVDQSIHCSKHLRRTDVSRRLVCETHRKECAFEPGAFFASDEVAACTSCGRETCNKHSHLCVEDGLVHCEQDTLALRNEPGKFVCRGHSTVCHVDQGTYRVGETVDCPVCGRPTCKTHLRSCESCDRDVCVPDFDRARHRCTTCTQLRPSPELSDDLSKAVASALGRGNRSKHWRTARDATHTIVEVDLGWTRRIVLAVRHGDNIASTGRSHSAVRSKKLKPRNRAR